MVVYKIEIEGRIYVGSSKNYEQRWKEHTRHLEGNKHHNPYLQRLYNKYGSPVFTIIETVETLDQMHDREEHWIKEIGELNSVKTATGGDRVSQLKGERKKIWKQKLAASQKARFEREEEREKCNCFRNLTPEEREARSKVWSEAKKGSKNNRYKYDKPVKQYDKVTKEYIRTYKDLCEVEEVTGFDRRNVLNCLKKKPGFNSAKGFIWEWVED